MTRPTDIRVTIERPADQYGSDWNWAEEATVAWKRAAVESGLTIEDETWEGFDTDTIATRVKVNGEWFDVEIGRRGDPDDVYAVPVED